MRRVVQAATAAAIVAALACPAFCAPAGVNPAFPLPVPGEHPQEVRSTTLVENPLPWNGRAVRFTGEAIGEAMIRGTMAWIHLNDDAYMWKNLEEGATLGGYNAGQAVWLGADAARRISFFGDFRHEGDVVMVTGRFFAACPEHGGDMDIHAATLEVIQPGHVVSNPVNWRRAGVAAGLLACSLLLWLVRRRAALRRI